MLRSCILVVAVVAAGLAPAAGLTLCAAEPAVDYRSQVAPLLAEHCYQCHGPHEAERQAGLRLDSPEAARAQLPSGSVAIVPGDPAASELMRRAASTDAQLRMPPADHGRALTADELNLLREWIAAGAEAAGHWSFEPPRRPEPPPIPTAAWARGSIDRFLAAEFESRGLAPSIEAPRPMLARRASLALTGLPPSKAELETFLADRSADAYERYLDRLFASPRYGEQMATRWLDLARYADTHGFHTDSHRDMWRWRDWVIDAYNRHMPLDRFITEQMAGDLLPNATLDQQIATGFHRNHMINFEDGALAEEYRNLYVVDRVNTTATVFLGLTLACAQCHDHKYDPFTQHDYYRLYAFLSSVPEQGIDGRRGNAAPFIIAPTSVQQAELAECARAADEAQAVMLRRRNQVAELCSAWEQEQRRASADSATVNRAAPAPDRSLAWHFSFDERGRAQSLVLETVSDRRLGEAIGSPLFLPAGKYRGGLLLSAGAGIVLEPPAGLSPAAGFALSGWVYPTTDDRMIAVTLDDDGQRWELGVERLVPFARQHLADGTLRTFTSAASVGRSSWSLLVFSYEGDEQSAGQFYIDGAAVDVAVARDESPQDATYKKLPTAGRLKIGGDAGGAPWRGMLDELRGYRRGLTADEAADLHGESPIAELLQMPVALRTDQQQRRVHQHYLTQVDREYREAQRQQRQATERREAILRAAPTSMVMQELDEPRPTHLLVRGDYRLAGPTVEPGTPAVLHAWPDDAPPNRLGLARWLVDPANPLTARVIVNRQWMHLFGRPLVDTPDDFGFRGRPPSHRQLLDYLAVELVESGWDLQHLQRLMLTSAAFRQTSDVSAEQLAADPDNRWYARYRRSPLAAEEVRDLALAAAGMLGNALGGRSVFPYQPEGLWEAVSYDPREFSAQRYTQSHGADLYRRSLYTFWKRASPPPSLSAFGAPAREVCTVSRPQAITAQQSLVIWNDPTYLEAARSIAERLLREKPARSDLPRVERLFEIMLSRQATEAERDIVGQLLAEQERHYRSDPESARALLAVGESQYDRRLDPAQLSAWTIAAQTLMMTDEFLTRP